MIAARLMIKILSYGKGTTLSGSVQYLLMGNSPVIITRYAPVGVMKRKGCKSLSTYILYGGIKVCQLFYSYTLISCSPRMARSTFMANAVNSSSPG